jgi:hypothetical protein
MINKILKVLLLWHFDMHCDNTVDGDVGMGIKTVPLTIILASTKSLKQ